MKSGLSFDVQKRCRVRVRTCHVVTFLLNPCVGACRKHGILHNGPSKCQRHCQPSRTRVEGHCAQLDTLTESQPLSWRIKPPLTTPVSCTKHHWLLVLSEGARFHSMLCQICIGHFGHRSTSIGIHSFTFGKIVLLMMKDECFWSCNLTFEFLYPVLPILTFASIYTPKISAVPIPTDPLTTNRLKGRLWCVLFESCLHCVWRQVSIAALIGLGWNGLLCAVLTFACTLHRYKTTRMMFKIMRSVSAGFCNIKWSWATKYLRILNRQDECLPSINVRFTAFHTSVRDAFVSTPLKVSFTAFKYNTWATCRRYWYIWTALRNRIFHCAFELESFISVQNVTGSISYKKQPEIFLSWK
jgi:hypothetical protein